MAMQRFMAMRRLAVTRRFMKKEVKTIFVKIRRAFIMNERCDACLCFSCMNSGCSRFYCSMEQGDGCYTASCLEFEADVEDWEEDLYE